MTLRTSYFGGIGSVVEPDEDDVVLGVVRYPRDFVDRVVDRNVPALAPPEELLDAYKTVEDAAERDELRNPSAVAWESVNFDERYLDHLDGAGQQQVIAEIRDRLRDDLDVFLVCWEKDVRTCHRRLLAEAIVDGLQDDVDDVEHHPAPDELQDDVDEPEDGPSIASLTDFGGGTA